METEEKPEMEVKKEEKAQKAANTSKILLYVMLFLIGALLGLLVGYNLPKEVPEEYSPELLDPVENQEAVNIILADSIVKLNNKLEASNILVDSLNTALDKCSSSKKTAVSKAKKPVTSSQEPPQKVVVEVVVKNPEIAEVVAEAPKKVVSQPTKAVVETPAIEVVTDPLAHLRDDNGEILVCFQINGSKNHHFPQYALDRGASIPNVRDNRQSGHNYVLLTPVNSISGDKPNVTFGGIFFIPVSYIKKYLDMSGDPLNYVKVLYVGNWRGITMTLQGNYYVYNTK